MTLETLPQQFIDADKIFNLRDIGGWDAADGKKVRTGRVFRADSLGMATEADLDLLVNRLGIRHVIDLRRAEEWEIAGRFPEVDGVEFHHFELLHVKWERLAERDVRFSTSRKEVVRFLRERYSGMYEAGYRAVRDSLDVIASGEPVLFHCMAGKDRTGLVAAALLSVLGVDEEDIAADYALSNVGITRWRAWRDANLGKPPVESSLTTPAEAMLETIAEMKTRFGSMTGYVDATGFEQSAKLRELLLE
ncbi:tyrosine-protein phosphatase [Glycomyces sp. TRM65418]|uniref:tyrosine-protein phosphatase n=1 Tax=Glycomyces sp. TRM65418 TaxID=2867006 RepID=UPI001CE6046C|nr:tyrosine-protein phosphatase [Glycomyces sp. TRM65418]MCC3764833.1 tyrosine-protein phosphatase [Glycomyces sp. TRM65418]QZD54482.1 tyrosine-protein phosphatase [Glycomyces sp. TRM65418]